MQSMVFLEYCAVGKAEHLEAMKNVAEVNQNQELNDTVYTSESSTQDHAEMDKSTRIRRQAS